MDTDQILSASSSLLWGCGLVEFSWGWNGKAYAQSVTHAVTGSTGPGSSASAAACVSANERGLV